MGLLQRMIVLLLMPISWTLTETAGGATVDAEARTAINALLAEMRSYRLIAT